MPLRIAIVFDTPYPASWGHDEHLKQMDDEIAGRINVPEPEVEYQVADALRQNGHEINLVGLRTDLGELVRRMTEWKPDLVFNCAEGFGGNDQLEYVIPSLLQALEIPCVGSQPLRLIVSRNKAMSEVSADSSTPPGAATFSSGSSSSSSLTAATFRFESFRLRSISRCKAT